MTPETATAPGGNPEPPRPTDHAQQSYRSGPAPATGADLLQAALDYAEHRWPVFPGRPQGKEPLTPSGFKAASTDPAVIRAWWARWPDANIGLHVGGAGLLVVDLDVDPTKGLDGVAILGSLVANVGPLPDTPRSRTGRGGLHYFFRDPGGLSPRNGVRPGVDLKVGGAYVLLPPSIHPNGTPYRWEVAPW